MKSEKFLITVAFRLLALVLCLTASIPQMQADVTIFVRGTAPKLYVFNTNGTAPNDGSTSGSGIQMSEFVQTSDGVNWYYVHYQGLNSCSIRFNNGNGSQTENITNVSGSQYFYSNGADYYINLTSLKGVNNFVLYENSNGWSEPIKAHCWNGNYSTSWPGDQMEAIGRVSQNGNKIYKWSKTNAPGMIIFNGGNGTSQTGNLTYRNKYYYYGDGTNPINNYANIVYPELPQPPTPHYYVTGDSGIGLGGFTCNPSLELTDSDNDGIYTCTTTATATGLYGFILANGKNNDWNIFNNNYRIGPTDGNVNVPLNGSFQQTQLAGGDHGSYRVAVAPGSVTFHFNPTDMTFKVTGTAPTTYDYTFYVLLPNGAPNLYLWDSSQNKLNGEWPGTAMSETEILDDGKTWYKFTGSYITQQINAIVNLGNNANQSRDITGLAPGTHYITWDGGNKTQASVSPTAPLPATIYINGDGILGGFSYQPSHTMTYTGDHIYTYTANLASKSTIQFVFGNGQGSSWDDYNNNYRIGPNNGSQVYNINSGYTSTQMASGNNGSYKVTAGAGTVTFFFNNVTMQYKVEGTVPPVSYYVVGDDTSIFPNGWNTGNGTEMQQNGNIFTWTSGQIHLNHGTYYGYKVKGDDDTWHPASDGNLTFTPDVSGDYTVTITYDRTDPNNETITAVLNLVTADPIYIEGSEGLGLQWGYAPSTTMTYDQATGLYSYSCNVAQDGTYNFFFANGQSDNWDDFNRDHRIGPQSGDQAIAIDNNWVATQMAQGDGGNYQINVAAGPVTIYFNPATMQFKVDATAPSYQYTFYIYPSDGTTTPHIYLWDNAENVYTNAYPGNQVTVTEQLEDGKTWFKYTNTILVDVLNAIISAGGSNADNTKTKNITNFEPGTYYIVWDPVRANGDEYNHFELYNDPPTAVGEHQLFIHGGYYHEGQTYNYASDSGSEMKYYRNPNNPDEEYYYINNITLSSNSTFCFTTLLGNDWQNVGIRYGNGGGNGGTEYTDNPNGTNYLEVNESRINTMMPLGVWSETYGEFKMFTAGVYNILASPSGGWVKLIKTDHKSLSPMNVYLEQTPNVEIDNIQEPGTTYTTAMFSGYWPLSAYNQEQGGWDPNSDSQHYPVTYIGDTTTVDGKKWWHWQVNASIAEVFFTRTNDKNPKQSEAIVRHAGVLWYTWDEINGQTVMTDHTREYFEAAANALPSNVVVMEGHYYVYFINTLGWDRVFCYAWDEADGQYTDGYNRVMEVWPGHICELMGIDPVTGYEVWRYDLGTISSIENAPDGILFNDGDTNALSDSKEQTGDFEYINGGVYDYLGLFDGSYTLNNLIRTAAEDVRYTVSNDLLGVYYDPNVKTVITYKNKYDEPVTETVVGALYAKDLNQYGEKSLMSKIDDSDGKTYTDYVYGVCASKRTPGGSQIMVNKTAYDQSNWIKLIMSPNYDGRNPTPVADNERPALSEYVDCIIPAGSLDVFMTDTINPTAHVLAIKKGEAMTYEPNVYISGNFNDTVVFNYTHRDWQPKDKDGNPAYKGNMRTKPVITWNYDESGKVTGGTVTREAIEEDPYYMFFVAPKPQEIAYITWVVYDNDNTNNEWPGYSSDTYQPYTNPNGSDTPPADPGSFYAPMNWDRSIKLTGKDYENMQYMSETQVEEYLAQGAHAAEYGNYYNGYMQYGGVKVNWSLFNIDTNNAPWWHIFTPGQAYKFKAIIRYARGNGEVDGVSNSTNNFYYGPGISDYDESEDYHYDDPLHINHAPLREASSYANVYFTKYDHLDESKFIIFPIRATASRSNGDGIGNVTSVQEVIADVNVPRDIVAVKYYNMMGIESDKPFDGINIIVTFYSDGSRSSRKVLR